ncbi:MAG: ABC transporter ATP-binding protein [Flavobacteriaceae bacterium]|nr:ABC transporter ATP-binding protein [Flavobacteriaceae bacterium]
MLQINNLTKVYQDATVLKIDELNIKAGTSLGLVGNNGAGKTTLFNLILDLIPPTTGHIINQDIQVNKSEQWKNFTGSFIDESFLIEYLTPEEYFCFVGELRGMTRVNVSEFLKPFSEIFNGEILGKKKYLRDLSKGNQKKVGIIAALMGEPKMVILDEPFANLDPSTQIKLKKVLKGYTQNNNMTLLISSHDLGHVTDVCDRIIVLEKGELIKDILTSSETLNELEHHFTS